MNSRSHLSILLASLALALLAASVRAAPSDREREDKARECEALRMKYAASDAYNPYDDVVSDLRVQCSDQMLNKDFAKAIELAERGLKRDPYNIHLLMMEATGEVWKVAGRRSDMAATGPSPGRTPTSVPSRTPMKHIRRLAGWNPRLWWKVRRPQPPKDPMWTWRRSSPISSVNQISTKRT